MSQNTEVGLGSELQHIRTQSPSHWSKILSSQVSSSQSLPMPWKQVCSGNVTDGLPDRGLTLPRLQYTLDYKSHHPVANGREEVVRRNCIQRGHARLPPTGCILSNKPVSKGQRSRTSAKLSRRPIATGMDLGRGPLGSA